MKERESGRNSSMGNSTTQRDTSFTSHKCKKKHGKNRFNHTKMQKDNVQPVSKRSVFKIH
jgi:hypothetical protein